MSEYTDQEMVRWALEESSEPVIKNPYLRSMFRVDNSCNLDQGGRGMQEKVLLNL